MRQEEEDGRLELNRREKQALEMLLVCASELQHRGETLRARTAMKDRNGWRYFRLAMTFMQKALDLVYGTIPVRQLLQIEAMCKSGSVCLTTAPSLMPTGYTPVKNADVNVLCASSVNQKCALCVLNGMEARRCALRGTLMTIWPPKELPKYGDCPYQGVRWYEESGEVPENDPTLI